jgi:Cu-Zn family superoxide dismutase
MKTELRIAAAAAALLLAGAAQAQAPASTTTELKNASGASIGKVTLTDAPKGVVMRIEAQGLTPGWHGLHFHAVGDCSKSDFTSAGPHVHGAGTALHGLLNPQANEMGDLPNLFADTQGGASGEFFTTLVSLRGAGGRPALLDQDGSAVVVHANADDHTTQPIGGAGARLACAVIK